VATKPVSIAGAGLAGCAAAIAARTAGAEADLYDPARAARHKVCGEFLTPEIEPVLKALGLWDRFLGQQPARMSRMRLIFDGRAAESRFETPAYGLSRLALDTLLREAAVDSGARLRVERAPADCTIVAYGRTQPSKGDRLFGFKAHFSGPVSDAVELYFFERGYIGVNPVEDGITNVCGLAAESLLRDVGFDPDRLLDRLGDRLGPYRRQMDWLTTGPLVYHRSADAARFLTGDALQFVDPFTGTGMTIALWTGALAGRMAAAAETPTAFYRRAGTALDGQRARCQWLRQALAWKPSRAVAPLIPPAWLYALTRPKLESR
jgi:flavin-dependent dehydrogenase